MIIKTNIIISEVKCWSWSFSKSESWSYPRCLSIFRSRVRSVSFDSYWSKSWFDYSFCSNCWRKNI